MFHHLTAKFQGKIRFKITDMAKNQMRFYSFS